jgi:serine phosphatase RsbU (regulator of sigma subunit)/anti-sigma regulatory factor (Ser/Thr protein kinase)
VQEPDERATTAAYAPEPSAAAEARRFVRETLRAWGLPGPAGRVSDLVDDAVLLTSELVTNAVVHAGTQVQVTCRMNSKAVEVAVRDRHPARALGTPLQPPGDPAVRTSGRGLLLPSALATAWGVTYARTSKAVWFRIAFADRPAGEILAGGAPAGGALEASAPEAGPREAATMAAEGNGALTVPADTLVLRDVPAAEPGDLLYGGIAEIDGDSPAYRLDLGRLGYEELLRHTVETARDAVDADAAYALVADEDGELRMRAAAGLGPPAVLDALSGLATQAQSIASRSVMTVPFLVEGRVTGILAVASGRPDTFEEGDSARLQRVADRMALSLERARLGELERARRGRVSFLAEASDLLAGTLDQEKIIALAAQLVVPRLASWCAVLLNDDAGIPRPAYVWHADESRLDALGRLLDTVPVPEVPSRGGGRSWSLALDDTAGLPPETVELASDAAWCFPLAARGRSLGVMVIGRARGSSLPREVTELAEDLARRTALAVDNAQLYERQQETSRALQRSLLPPEVPQIPGLDLAVAHEVAGEGNEVGGDFYDVFAVGEGRWRFTIGDVCGTGPAAAAVTGLARHTLRILAGEGYGIAAVLDRLNRLLQEPGAGATFITLIHGEIYTAAGEAGTPGGAEPPGGSEASGGAEPRGGSEASGGAEPPGGSAARPPGAPGVRLSLVCAGHPLPLLLRAGNGTQPAEPPRPAAEPQPLLGVIDELTFTAQDLFLFPGDLVLCVTDGVTERRDEGSLLDDDDGLTKLLADCAGLSAGAVAARIQRTVSEYGTGLSADDMALLVLRAL